MDTLNVYKAIDEFEASLTSNTHQQGAQSIAKQSALWSALPSRFHRFITSKNQPIFLPPNQIPPLM